MLKPILPRVLIAAAVGWGAGRAWAADLPDSPNVQKVVIPFDFVSRWDHGRYGQMVAESIWKKLDRQKGFIIPESIEDVRELCSANNIRITPETPLEQVGQIVRKDFDAQIGIWGSVERAPGTDGEIYDLTIRCVDFSAPGPKIIYEKTNVRTNSVSEIPHRYVQEMLDRLYDRQPAALPPPDPAAEQRWAIGPNLVVGDFEEAVRGVPKGWEARAGQKREPLGNLVKWVLEQGGSSNHVIRFEFPQAVGDNEGVMYYSDPFPIQDGARYRFQCRWRSSGPNAKVFIKCYDQIPTEYREEARLGGSASSADPVTGSLNAPGAPREVYRSQHNLTGPKNTWNVHTQDFTPRHTRYSPQYGRVMLYAYLGGGVVEFDDIVVKQIAPAESQNLAREPRHSLGTKVTIRQMQENQRRGREAQQRLRHRKPAGKKDEG